MQSVQRQEHKDCLLLLAELLDYSFVLVPNIVLFLVAVMFVALGMTVAFSGTCSEAVLGFIGTPARLTTL